MDTDNARLSTCLRELEAGMIILDAMLRRDGYTVVAQATMEELRAYVTAMAAEVE